MIVIGVTGSLGSGKSTVAGIFRGFGAHVLDADKIARRALKKSSIHAKIKRHFGKTVITGKVVDRKKLAEIVFSERGKLKHLNNIVHPFVIRDIKGELAAIRARAPHAVVVIDAPLLIESKLHKLVDNLVVVKATAPQELHRSLRKLKITKTQAKNRIESQMPLGEKIKLADYIIDNSKTIKQTRRQAGQIWEKLARR
ncbi:MAG: dephospho-CoA kinase [Candidatus Omnitrophota bacterium]